MVQTTTSDPAFRKADDLFSGNSIKPLLSTSVGQAPETDTSGRLILLACIATVFVWVLVAAHLNPAQPGDNLEQFIWAQGFEWGYWKHPPLTSWVLLGVASLFGHGPQWTYLLAAASVALTIYAIWKIARELVPADVALWVPIILSLHYGFSRKAQFYNHNTLLILFIALATLMLLWSIQKNQFRHWGAFGLACGLAILSKYQALVPIAGLFWIAWRGRVNQGKKGLWVGTGVLIASLVPHLMWLASNDLTPIGYAQQHFSAIDYGEKLTRIGSFFAAQGRFYFPVILFFILAYMVRSASAFIPAVKTPEQQDRFRTWMMGLVAIPVGGVILSCLIFGARIQDHWGLQATQFLCLPVAVIFMKALGAPKAKWLLVYLLVQGGALTAMVGHHYGLTGNRNLAHIERHLAARKIVHAAQSKWDSTTACPLKYVTGHPNLAALVAAYSDKTVKVYDAIDLKKTPWINGEDVSKSGYVDIRLSERQLLLDVNSDDSIAQISAYGNYSGLPSHWVILTLKKPQVECG